MSQKLSVVVRSLVLATFAGSASAAPITFGALSNFDVINDTGTTARGFEIELEGLSAADIVFTFGAPYIRYGDPVKIPTATGVIIRYSAQYNSGTWSTPVNLGLPPGQTDPGGTPAGNPSMTTMGHQCYIQGDPSYPTSGCEHFGIANNGNPTSVIYRWLIEGSTPGTLVSPGTNVQIPAPIWKVTPPPPGQPAAQPRVQAVVAAAPPEGGAQFGVPQWVKIYVTEAPHPVELDQLVVGNAPNPNGSEVPDAAEVEIEWELLQSEQGGGGREADSGEKEVGAGAEAVSRRYEFFKYTGELSSEGEALCDNPTVGDVANCGPVDPLTGLSGVGDFIGAQNAALNLDPFAAPAPEPGSLALLGVGLAGLGFRRRGRA